MDLSQLPGLALIWIIAVASPGPDMVAVLQQAIARSRRAGLATALGTTTGAAVWLLAALFGLSALLQGLPWLMTWLELGGGALLVVIGITGLRAWRAQRRQVRDLTPAGGAARGPDTGTGRADPGDAEATGPGPGAATITRQPLRRSYLKGLGTNLANPKALVFFAALFTPFLTGTILSLETAVVVAALILLTLAWFCAVALTASAPRFAPVIDRFRTGFDLVASGFFVLVGAGFVLAALRAMVTGA